MLALLALPFCLYAVVKLPIGSAGVHQWLPEGRQERLRYESFAADFGSDQVVLLSWDDCTINDPRLAAFKVRITQIPQYSSWFTKLESTDTAIEALMEPPSRLSMEAAKSRLRGVLTGIDDIGCIVLGVTEEGVLSHKQVIHAIRTAADEVPGLGREQLRMVGTVFEAYAVDEAAETSLQKFVIPSSILGFLFSALCLGSLRGATMVLVLATFGQLLTVALVFFTGYQFSAVLIVLPTLVFVLTLSGAIHLVNYFFEDHSGRFPTVNDRGVRSLVIGWKPCVLSSVTTMLGMGSLYTSQLAPVRQFGIFSAVGLGLATVFLLIAFPLVSRWILGAKSPSHGTNESRIWNPKDRQEESQNRESHQRNTSWQSIRQWILVGYVDWMEKQCFRIAMVSILLIGITSGGLYYLRSSTKFCDMFPESSRTNLDMQWFERHVGPIATVEVLVHFHDSSRDSLLNQVRWIQVLGESLRDNETVGGVFSVATFVTDWPSGSSLRATAKRSVLKNRIDSSLEDLAKKGLVSYGPEGRTWRLMSKVSAVSPSSYGEMTESIRKSVNEVIESEPSGTEQKPDQIVLTGLSPVMNDTQIAILQDLGLSFLSAFLLITPVMMWVTSSVRGGLLIMLPNVFPVTFAFGMMGWLGLSLDIAGILTASIAMGIAVDDTLHFVSWYKRELDSGMSRIDAVKATLSSCGNAMFHTTLISCSAMVPFMFSDFVPTGQFAKLMVVMLVGAIVGDIVMLPALLLSPLGKVIAPRNTKPPAQLGVP